FEAATVGALLVAHAIEVPRRPSSLTRSFVPEALDDVVLECLAKEPDARPPSADALDERLAAVPLARPWTESLARRGRETNHRRKPWSALATSPASVARAPLIGPSIDRAR